MSPNRSTTPVGQATGENTKKSHAENIGDNNNTGKEMESEANRGTTHQDAQTSGVEKSASSEAKPETGKENKGPDQSKPPVVQSHETKDYQKEFGEWKGSSNPSYPKWAGPPYLHGPAAPNDGTGASGGPCPGMGMWGSS